MSITASRYADYGSACPRCQQIISTIDITFQQGIFIYDLTFIQQELESVLVAALQRQNQLLQEDGQSLMLPSSSMIRLPNGKKARDCKVERERKRKALGGQITRKRRMKKSSTINLLKAINRERNYDNSISMKKKAFNIKPRSETNGNSTRPVRSYRPINFTFPFYYETNSRHRNNHRLSANKLQINNVPYPDQFWTKITTNQHEFIKSHDCNCIANLIQIDQSLMNNGEEYKQTINFNEYLLSREKYLHPELEYSIVLKQNSHLYNRVENLLNNNQQKNSSISSSYRFKRKYSTTLNSQNSIQIDDSILKFFQRDNK